MCTLLAVALLGASQPRLGRASPTAPGPLGLEGEKVTKFVVDQIFPAYEVHLTGGASGSGKTTLEGQLIEDWRQGKPVFGYKSFPAPFCYIACDRSLQSIHATLKRIGVPHDEWPILSLIDHGNLNTPEQIVAAARRLVSNVEVVWLDGIHSLTPQGQINDYGTVQTFLTCMTRIAQREKLTFKCLGHATKVREGEAFLNPRHRFLGSVAWGGYSDTMVIIDQEKPQDPTDTTRNVYLLPRNAANEMFKYEFVEGRLTMLTDAGQFCLDRWLAGFKAGDLVTTANVLTAGEKAKVSKSTCNRWIKQAIDSGKLLKTGHGVFTVSFPQ